MFVCLAFNGGREGGAGVASKPPKTLIEIHIPIHLRLDSVLV